MHNLQNNNVTIYEDDNETIEKTFSTDNTLTVNTSTNNEIVDTIDDSSDIINKKICTLLGTKNGANEFNIGDKYVCEVSPGVSYNFYVVGMCGNNKVNMIMSQNLLNSVAWITPTDYGDGWSEQRYSTKGPLTALKTLESATQNWTNIVPYNYTLIDEINDYSTYYRDLSYHANNYHWFGNDPDVQKYLPIERYNVRARLFTRNEASSCGCTRFANTCPSFLAANSSVGYWLSNAGDDYDTINNNLRNQLTGGNDIIDDGGDSSYVYREDKLGIRPVITVYRTQIN